VTPSRLAAVALALWPLSYIWIPFSRGDGDSGPVVLGIVVASELGAVIAGTAAVVTGLWARRRSALRAPAWPVAAGVAVVALVVGLNLLWTFADVSA
jgi:hypothetical protein